MSNVARQIISSSNSVTARKEAPRVVQRVAPPEAFVGTERIHRYITNQGQHHQLKIVAIAGDEEDEALVRVVLSYPEFFNGVFQFVDWAFATPRESAALLLDKRIRMGWAKGISRDMESIMVRCASCDNLYPNTDAGRRDMMEHQIYDHFNDTANYFQPQTVGGVNAIGQPFAEATEEDLHPTVVDPGEDAPDVPSGLGEDFTLTSERVPEEVMASMESEDAGNQDPKRVRGVRQNQR
jgi:hypothetical protein